MMGAVIPKVGFGLAQWVRKQRRRPARFTDITKVIWYGFSLRLPFLMRYVLHQMGIPLISPTPRSGKFLAVNLDADGWPCSAPRVAVDLTGTADNPDGAVVDAQGNIWNAQWGAARLACYSPKGVLLQTLEIGAAHATCPAFAGASGQIFCTSATEGIAPEALTGHDGQTFVAEVSAIGQLEHQVIL